MRKRITKNKGDLIAGKKYPENGADKKPRPACGNVIKHHYNLFRE